MAQKYYNVREQGRARTVTNLKKYLALEVESISATTDYIQVTQLVTVNQATAVNLVDGTLYTCTVSESNKVTIDAVASEDHVIFLVVGV